MIVSTSTSSMIENPDRRAALPCRSCRMYTLQQSLVSSRGHPGGTPPEPAAQASIVRAGVHMQDDRTPAKQRPAGRRTALFFAFGDTAHRGAAGPGVQPQMSLSSWPNAKKRAV